MRVTTVCELLISISRPPRHRDSFNLVCAIKAEDFSGHANVPLGGRSRFLTTENRDDALVWAGEMLAPHIKGVFGSAPMWLVTIPGSQCTSPHHVMESRGGRIASSIAAAMSAPTCNVQPILWWDGPMVPAHRGGSRSPGDLAPRYQVAPRAGELLDTLPELVLVDDVLTHAGHFRSAGARLRAAGYRVADAAFAVGRTVWPDEGLGSKRLPTDAAFSVTTETFEDFVWP